jgi:hypothetical protein
MARLDYQPIIENEVMPDIVDNIVTKEVNKLYSWFTKNTNIKGGDRITDQNAIALTGAGGAFTRADANPPSLTKTFAKPHWLKKYYHEAVEIRREDLDEHGTASPDISLISSATADATKLVMEYVFDGIMTQIKSDVDATGDYSDAAITRVAALASYENTTDTAMTLALIRAGRDAIRLKKDFSPEQYQLMFENNVWDVVQPLIAVQGNDTTAWVQNDPGDGVKSGYRKVTGFDDIDVASMYGMTVGDAFMLRKADVQIQEHKGLEIEQVEMDAYSLRFVVRIGVNGWVRRPAFQAKWTNKD